MATFVPFLTRSIPNDPISDIAARLDEFDTKGISRRFKELKGCTPSEFRKKHLRKL